MKLINDNNEEIELTRLVSLMQYSKNEKIHYTTAQYRVFSKAIESVIIDGKIYVITPENNEKFVGKKRGRKKKEEVNV